MPLTHRLDDVLRQRAPQLICDGCCWLMSFPFIHSKLHEKQSAKRILSHTHRHHSVSLYHILSLVSLDGTLRGDCLSESVAVVAVYSQCVALARTLKLNAARAFAVLFVVLFASARSL